MLMEASAKNRIYKNLKEIVAPRHTALVVWDVQNALVNHIFNQSEFLVNLKAFIGAARKNGIPVIYTKITPLSPQHESPFRTYMLMKRFGVDSPDKLPAFMFPGSQDTEIPEQVAPLKNDLVFNKHTISVFTGTHFEQIMRNMGINTLLFTGIATEIGVDTSARDSVSRGFYTIVAENCSSSMDKNMHYASLQTLKSVCLVLPSGEITKEW
jgi:nicotinamidase-related amidase